MAGSRYGSVRFNYAEWARMQNPGGSIDAGFARAAGRTRDRARRNIAKLGRIDTGRMSQAMYSKRTGQLEYEVGSPVHYAGYQEHGTKGHGPRRAKVMRFKPKGGKGFVFAKYVRGITPGKFLENALKDLTPDDFEA